MVSVTSRVPAVTRRRDEEGARCRSSWLAVAWWWGCREPDVLLAASGFKRGATAKAVAARHASARSRLSRDALFERFATTLEISDERDRPFEYTIDPRVFFVFCWGGNNAFVRLF